MEKFGCLWVWCVHKDSLAKKTVILDVKSLLEHVVAGKVLKKDGSSLLIVNRLYDNIRIPNEKSVQKQGSTQ